MVATDTKASKKGDIIKKVTRYRAFVAADSVHTHGVKTNSDVCAMLPSRLGSLFSRRDARRRILGGVPL